MCPRFGACENVSTTFAWRPPREAGELLRKRHVLGQGTCHDDGIHGTRPAFCRDAYSHVIEIRCAHNALDSLQKLRPVWHDLEISRTRLERHVHNLVHQVFRNCGFEERELDGHRHVPSLGVLGRQAVDLGSEEIRRFGAPVWGRLPWRQQFARSVANEPSRGDEQPLLGLDVFGVHSVLKVPTGSDNMRHIKYDEIQRVRRAGLRYQDLQHVFVLAEHDDPSSTVGEKSANFLRSPNSDDCDLLAGVLLVHGLGNMDQGLRYDHERAKGPVRPAAILQHAQHRAEPNLHFARTAGEQHSAGVRRRQGVCGGISRVLPHFACRVSN
mmetsp:Transcript_2690/g.6822  ORF Transcript_2690/g.6822 Transcript_2690/m.6822 type:complete len:326 (+) Transcript_2690:873-1850(+)